MKRLYCLGLLLAYATLACASTPYPGLKVGVQRTGTVYTLSASFDTPLSPCAAYQYLTDYEAAKKLPGVVSSTAVRESAHEVKVDRTADEQVLFFHVRLHSIMRYTEQAMDHISFTQISGDSKSFQGDWRIIPSTQGSTLNFLGSWEPDSYLPNFVIDHFAENNLLDKFSAVAKLAESRRDVASPSCKADVAKPVELNGQHEAADVVPSAPQSLL
ncbi:MAG: SRPBCC family protein [Gallionella sp.]|nr:SRPBCC family protein [Gallionella sp.]